MQQKTINNRRFLLLSLTTTLAIVVVDQITKTLVLKGITSLITNSDGSRFFIKISSFLNIILVWNSGISFGIFNGSKFMPNVLLFVNILISSLIAYMIAKKSNTLTDIIALSFILGGAIGNITDRIFRGAVIDFIDFHFKQHHWPAFNFADSSIFIGILLYLIYDLFYRDKNA